MERLIWLSLYYPKQFKEIKFSKEIAFILLIMHEDLFIRKANGLFMKVDSRIIILAEASGGCSKIVTKEGGYLVNSTLTQLEEILPAAHFCRVNRSCIAGMDYITGFSADTILILDREVPLVKAYRTHFLEKVKIVI